MARVFISHTGENRALARKLHRWLVEAGHEVFLDQDLRDGIVPGEDWEQRLHERLRWANAVICVVTSTYLNCIWCAAEIGIARARGSQLLPLCAEPGVVHPMLATLQHIDYTADSLAAYAALINALNKVDDSWPEDRSPFPGLRPFELDQHQVFFGRKEEVEELVKLLRSPAERAEGAVLLVVGPSGCGKSSLVRAGLLAVMAEEPGWQTLPPILPGADPVGALARELAAASRQSGLNWTLAHVRDQLDQGNLSELADELLLAAPGGRRQRLLVVVDQLEELFTQTASDQRAEFAELLRPALTGPVQVVATLRPEFLDQLLADPELAGLPTHTYPLRPLRRGALRDVIEKPARLAGINLDDGLADRLVNDTDSGDALPLLAFILAQLAEDIGRGGRLSVARYEQLGGVHGALTRQADAALKDATNAGGRSHQQVIAGLLRLVTVDEQGRPTRWRLHRDELPAAVLTELNAFVARRLLTTNAENGTVVISVAHDAFLSAWPPLAHAIDENVSALRASRAVESAATEWHDKGRPRERLWSGGQLAAAVADVGARIRRFWADGTSSTEPNGSSDRRRQWHGVLVTDQVDVKQVARDFLLASMHRERYHRRRITSTLTLLLIGALVAGGVAVYQRGSARNQLLITTTQYLLNQADTFRENDPRRALLFGIAAERIHPDDKTRASLVHTLSTIRYTGTLRAEELKKPVTAVAFTPNGFTLATGTDDGTVAMWDLSDPTQLPLPRFLRSHGSTVNSMAFSPNERTLAVGTANGTMTLWDVTDPARPEQSWEAHTCAVNAVAFSPDKKTLATASDDKTVILWNLTDPTQPKQLRSPLTGHAAAVLSVAFSPDGRSLATGDSDGTVIQRDAADPTQTQQPWQAHTGAVNSVAFSPNSSILATAGDDNTANLWKLNGPTEPQRLAPPLSGHKNRVIAAAFDPDNGNTLATTSEDTTTIVWDITDPTQPKQLGPPLEIQTTTITAGAFATTRTLATGCSDGAVILWDFTELVKRSGPPLTGQPSPVESVMFDPDGLTVTVTSTDGTVIQRDPNDPTRLVLGPPLTRSSGPVPPLASSPDGNTTVTADESGSVILWDLTDQSQPRRLGTPLEGHLSMVTSAAFSADGSILATGSDDGDTILWDLTDRNQPRPLTRPLRQPLAGDQNPVTSIAFSTDGRTLVTGRNDGQTILWDLTDQSQPRPLGTPLTGHTGSVTSVAFSPDGNTLATGGSDTTVILWDLKDLTQLRDNGIEQARAITGRGLDSPEWDSNGLGLPYQNTCA